MTIMFATLICRPFLTSLDVKGFFTTEQEFERQRKRQYIEYAFKSLKYI